MRDVGGLRREHDLGIGRDFDGAWLAAAVLQRQAAQLGIVDRRDDEVERRVQIAVVARPGGALLREARFAGIRRDGRGLVCRGPDLAGRDVGEIEIAAERVAGRILAPARDRAFVPGAVAAARGRDHDGVAAVRQQVHDRRGGGDVVDAALALGRLLDDLGRDALLLDGAGPRRRPGHLFLEQQLGSLDARVGVEARRHRSSAGHRGERVGQRDDGHALVVRHEGAHDFEARAVGQPFGREVDALVEAEAAARAEPLQALEVADRGQRRVHGCERRRIGRDHELPLEAAFQAEAGHAEGRILVSELGIAHVVGRLGNAPGHALGGAVVDLRLDGAVRRLVEQAVGGLAQHQRRHQVLEHRAGPGDQQRPARPAGETAAEMAPVAPGDIALGDGHEARQPRLGGEQVVVAGIELGTVEAPADREQLPLGIVEEAEVHVLDALEQTCGQGLETRSGRPVEIAPLRLQPFGEQRGRRGELGGRLARVLGHECVGELDELARERLQRRHGLGGALCIARRGEQRRGAARDHRSDLPGPDTRAGRCREQRRERLAHELQRVGEAVERSDFDAGACALLAQPVRERQQMGAEVAAVDRGDVARLERLDAPRVVPVEQVAAVLLEPLDRRQRGLDARQRVAQAQPAEIARARDREQIQRDVGRRGAVRGHRVRRLLQVVGRQVVFGCGDRGLEVAPGDARRAAQRQHRRRARAGHAVGCIGRAADAERDDRRQPPQQQQWRSLAQRRGPQGHDHGGREHHDDGRALHRPGEGRQAEVRLRLRLRGGDPFEQASPRQELAQQRAADRIAHQPGVLREQRQGRERVAQVDAEPQQLGA